MAPLVRFVLVIASTIASLLAAPAYSQDISGFCSQKDSAIFFGNGVWSDRADAKIALQELENSLSIVLSPDELQKVEFGLAYNTTNGKLEDLFESFIQDISTDVTLLWRTLAVLVPMPESFRDKLVEFAAAIDEQALLNTQDLSIHVIAYKNKILEGKKVILVSHSQGNLFANQAYGNLSTSEQNSFGIVAVANPDSFVATGGPHVTLFEDLVIVAIRLAKARLGLPTPQLPNVTNFLTLSDLTGHFFVESYLAPNSNSKSDVLNDIVNVRAALPAPATTAGQGVITVTLTWGPQPDVDLHAFEPNGTHVYYANRFGPSGFLDVDDVTSFGPEHYFVGCDTLETGTYRIGVNYYSGSAPEVANILIQGGLQSRGFTIFLPTALGFSGDASPQPVGTINVTGNSQDGFQFNIQ